MQDRLQLAVLAESAVNDVESEVHGRGKGDFRRCDIDFLNACPGGAQGFCNGCSRAEGDIALLAGTSHEKCHQFVFQNAGMLLLHKSTPTI